MEEQYFPFLFPMHRERGSCEILVFVNTREISFDLLSSLIVIIYRSLKPSINPVDVVLMIIFGGVGFLMRKFDYEPAPLMLAFILGPMLEKSLRQSLILSNGSILIFWIHPIPRILLLIAAIIICLPILKRFIKKRQSRRSANENSNLGLTEGDRLK